MYYSPHSDPQSMSEPSRLVYRRISGVLLSVLDVVGVILTLTCEPRRGMFDATVARCCVPKPYAWNELLLEL